MCLSVILAWGKARECVCMCGTVNLARRKVRWMHVYVCDYYLLVSVEVLHVDGLVVEVSAREYA